MKKNRLKALNEKNKLKIYDDWVFKLNHKLNYRID